MFTDIGIPCENVIHYFKQCQAAFLESNYDDTMLEEGRYPYFLKSRIRGNKGHLSNKQAVELFSIHKPSFMSHLFLSHLSKNNNCPALVQKLFNKKAAGVKVIIASRDEETPVYQISNVSVSSPIINQASSSQLSFAFA